YEIEHRERPIGFVEVTYRNALVPIFGTSVNTEAMARAARIVGPDAEVQAVFVLKVPHHLPLSAELPQEADARAVLEVARLQARAKGLKVRVKLLHTRNPGAAIVKEARERHSDLIYIDTQHAPADER